MVMAVITLATAVFLWQYNLMPFWINAKISIAEDLANTKNCEPAFVLADNVLESQSFLDAYSRLKYIEFIKTCDAFYPENDLVYARKGVEIMKEAVIIQPRYSRLWLFLGSFTEIIASHEKDVRIKASLLKEASGYLDKADQLAPHHQEISIAKVKVAMTAGDYQEMEVRAKTCIALNPNSADCWWQLGLAQIYLQQFDEAKVSIQKAEERNYRTDAPIPLNQLVDAYAATKNYQELVVIYQRLIIYDHLNAQYHASLAFVYKALGKYTEARQEVKRFLELAPNDKATAEDFLKSLDYR